MEYNKLSLQEFFSQQNILYLALVAGVILFGLLALAMNILLGIDFDIELPFELIYAAVGFVLIMFFVSDYMYQKGISKIDDTIGLQEKLVTYRSASILQYALVEAAALLAGVGYLVTGSYLYFILLGVTVGYFLHLRPTKAKMSKELNLSYADQQKMGFE